LAAVLATARITAFKPGQSPPPVTMPIFIIPCYRQMDVETLSKIGIACQKVEYHGNTTLGFIANLSSHRLDATTNGLWPVIGKSGKCSN
jgi:hypothetical protein